MENCLIKYGKNLSIECYPMLHKYDMLKKLQLASEIEYKFELQIIRGNYVEAHGQTLPGD